MKKIFLYILFLSMFLNAQNDASKDISAPYINQNESYEISQIRKRQYLIQKKSGQYLGIGLGGIEIKKDYFNQNQIEFPAIFSLKTGVQTFFNKNIGIRGFFGLDFGTGFINYSSIKDPSHSFYAMASLGIDMIGEVPLGRSYKHFLGVFAGVGGGATIYTDNGNFSLFKDAIYAAGLLIEGGITLSIFEKHRIEFGVKILPTAQSLLNSKKFSTSLMPYVMYNYKF